MNSEAVRERRLRRLARRHGLWLAKSRARRPDRGDFGLYAVRDDFTGRLVNDADNLSWLCSWTLDDVETYLTTD